MVADEWSPGFASTRLGATICGSKHDRVEVLLVACHIQVLSLTNLTYNNYICGDIC